MAMTRKRQRVVECPGCYNHFNIDNDVVNRLCTRCNQWRPAIDFTSSRMVCKICLGVPETRFFTQVRLRTKTGDLLKQCGKCKLWKPETSYNKNNKAKDGLQHWCKDCNNRFVADQRAKEPSEEIPQEKEEVEIR